MKKAKLRFGKGNAKLKKNTAILSLPAGHTCPFAQYCHSYADRETGKLTDEGTIRCYAASAETLFPSVRKSRWHNFDALVKANTVEAMANLIDASLPRKGIKLVRIHASGDFFSQRYFDAWIEVAKRNPQIIFYGYTKALPFWVKRKSVIPSNLKLVASRGGVADKLIDEHSLRNVRIVFSEDEAKTLCLPLDHDDTLAWDYDGDFALLLHGTQPKGSEASKVWEHIKRHGRGGYKTSYFANKKN